LQIFAKKLSLILAALPAIHKIYTPLNVFTVYSKLFSDLFTLTGTILSTYAISPSGLLVLKRFLNVF